MSGYQPKVGDPVVLPPLRDKAVVVGFTRSGGVITRRLSSGHEAAWLPGALTDRHFPLADSDRAPS